MEEQIISRKMKDPQQNHTTLPLAMNPKGKQDKRQQNSRIKRASSHVNLWRQVKSITEEINGRYHHASVLSEGILYVYGGFDNDVGILSDFKMYNCKEEKGQWRALSVADGPGPRHSHSAVLHEGNIYIFGGKVDQFRSTNAFHVYNVASKKWKKLQPGQQERQRNDMKSHKNSKKMSAQLQKQLIKPSKRPSPIDSHQAVVINGSMIVYGGFSKNQFRNDVFSYNFTKSEWEIIYQGHGKELKPQPRSDFSMVVHNEKLYIYAGKNLSKNFCDLWQFDLKARTFREIQNNLKIANRSGHSAVVFNNHMIIFGGITSVTHERDDLLCFSFQKQKWGVIWNNCQDQTVVHRTSTKKASNAKARLLQNNLYKSKYEERSDQKPRKYRRPLAEQKMSTFNENRVDLREKQQNKKQKERKNLLISQIQTPSSHFNSPSSPQKFSPLLESLTNSIMLTSNVHHVSASSTSRQKGLRQLLTNNENDSDGVKVKEKKLKARDGHTAHVLGDEMVVFGGDRHMFAINDIVYINLDSLMVNFNLNEKKSEGQLVFESKQEKRESDK